MVEVYLYGDLKRRVGRQSIKVGGNRPLMDILKEIGEKFGVSDLIFRDGKVRGELLILVNGADWNSLGFLENVVPEAAKIKLVPVWHGG